MPGFEMTASWCMVLRWRGGVPRVQRIGVKRGASAGHAAEPSRGVRSPEGGSAWLARIFHEVRR